MTSGWNEAAALGLPPDVPTLVEDNHEVAVDAEGRDQALADLQSADPSASNGVQELAFWEVDQYDKSLGYAYSKIFNKITGGGPGGGGSFPSGYHQLVVQNSGLCLDQAGGVTTEGVQFDQWTRKSGTGNNQDFATK
jgi:hypothetical protein